MKRARLLSDDALNRERDRLLGRLLDNVITPAERRRYRSLTNEAERRWPRVTAKALAHARKLLRNLRDAR